MVRVILAGLGFCLFSLNLMAESSIQSLELQIDSDEEVTRLEVPSKHYKRLKEKKLFFFASGNKATNDKKSFIKETLDLILQDEKLELFTETSDRGSGNIEVRGRPMAVLFTAGSQGDEYPIALGMNGYQEYAIINEAVREPVLVQEVLIPVGNQDINQPTPSAETLAKMVLLSISNPTLAQREVTRYNTAVSYPQFENLTEREFLSGFENTTNILRDFLQGSRYAMGGGKIAIYGSSFTDKPSSYPTNFNFSTVFDVGYNVSVEDFTNNIALSMRATFSHEHLFPKDNGGSISCYEGLPRDAEAFHALQKRWIQQIYEWEDKFGFSETRERVDLKLNCEETEK